MLWRRRHPRRLGLGLGLGLGLRLPPLLLPLSMPLLPLPSQLLLPLL
jgi:hypothetical protein